jgi:hypothetical protein
MAKEEIKEWVAFTAYPLTMGPRTPAKFPTQFWRPVHLAAVSGPARN